MFELTDQEKRVALFVCLVLGLGTAAELSFKLFPDWRGAVSIVGNDAFFPRVNVNTASPEELEAVPHIGPVTARLIIEARSANGPLRSLDDLARAGLGEKTLRRVGKYLSF